MSIRMPAKRSGPRVYALTASLPLLAPSYACPSLPMYAESILRLIWLSSTRRNLLVTAASCARGEFVLSLRGAWTGAKAIGWLIVVSRSFVVW